MHLAEQSVDSTIDAGRRYLFHVEQGRQEKLSRQKCQLGGGGGVQELHQHLAVNILMSLGGRDAGHGPP